MPLPPSSRRRPPSAATLVPALLLSAVGLFLAVAGSACGGPEPFVPKTGCPTLTTCELCASRGGCGWCASSCVAFDGAQCSSGIVQAPNQCPGATPAQ